MFCVNKPLYANQRGRLITARKRSLGQCNIFAPVCHSVHGGGGGRPGQVHPRTRYAPRDQVHIPPRPGTPPRDQVHPPQSSACWEIRTTRGRYASYWNAFFFVKNYAKHERILAILRSLVFRTSCFFSRSFKNCLFDQYVESCGIFYWCRRFGKTDT